MSGKFSRIALWAAGRIEALLNEFSPDELREIEAELQTDGTKIAVITGRKVRISRKSAGSYTAVALASDPDRVRSKKIMGHDIDIVLLAAPTIEVAAQRAEQRTRRLIHNLKSLTAKTNQEVFALVQQDFMMASPSDMAAYIQREVSLHPADTAKALVEILKHQSAQKAEFAAFEKLAGKIDSIRVEKHRVHSVLMNVFYLFFGEFLANKVRVQIEPTRLLASFDYDSVHACIYYVVENAAKYVRRNSTLNVTCSSDGARVDIRFDMESLVISRDEEDRIFQEGFSGGAAIESRLNGAGIGLFLAREMARLNKGSLHVLAGRPAGRDAYARNSFVLTLPVAY